MLILQPLQKEEISLTVKQGAGSHACAFCKSTIRKESSSGEENSWRRKEAARRIRGEGKKVAAKKNSWQGKEADSMNRVRNYQKELDKILENRDSKGKTLYLHSCCAPCSSYVLEYLCQYFRITVFYYNPNISYEEEYRKRVEEEKRLIQAMNQKIRMGQETEKGDCGIKAEVSDCETKTEVSDYGIKTEISGCETKTAASDCGIKAEATGYEIQIEEGDYEPERFYEIAKGLEDCPEGGERCFACYRLRLLETAKRAAEGKYDYFTTTLTISPLKNAAKLNEIGEELAQEYEIAWLPSDFKKRNGYKRSIELSKEYDLYRQNYCGCVYSK